MAGRRGGQVGVARRDSAGTTGTKPPPLSTARCLTRPPSPCTRSVDLGGLGCFGFWTVRRVLCPACVGREAGLASGEARGPNPPRSVPHSKRGPTNLSSDYYQNVTSG